jgi:hypothetical protein
MKKINNLTQILVIITIITIFLLYGCSGSRENQAEPESLALEEKTESATNNEAVNEVVEQTELSEEPEETKTISSEESEEEEYNRYFESLSMDEKRKIKSIRKLLAQARESDENYFFRYSGPGILQTDVWVKDNMIKRSIHRADELDKFKTYNMVYLNSETETAEGYCETTKSKCFEGHGPFKETFDKWLIKTPKDWALELGDNFVWRLDNRVSDQLYHIIDYSKDGKTIRVHVHNYKGWPGKVEIFNSKKVDSITMTANVKYLYDDMDIGGVSDDDVTPRV